MATVRTVAGTAPHHLKTTHACASVGLRSPSTPSAVDGRNIQTLSTARTPSTPKLNVRGLARMFRRMDETNQTLETQIQSSYVQHWPLGVRGWRQLLIHGFEYLVHLLSKGVTFAYFWLVSIKSNIFIRSTLCFNLLCSTTLSHRQVESEDSRPQESKPDEEQFQLLFLLLPCAVSVPSAFPVPFHGLCAPASDFAIWLTFLLKRDSLSFCFNKTYQKHIFAGRATRKCKRHWKRHWKGTGNRHGTWQQ